MGFGFVVSVMKLPSSVFIEFLDKYEDAEGIYSDNRLEFFKKKNGVVYVERSHLKIVRNNALAGNLVNFVRHCNNYVFMDNNVDGNYRAVRITGDNKQHKQDISSAFNDFMFNFSKITNYHNIQQSEM